MVRNTSPQERTAGFIEGAIVAMVMQAFVGAFSKAFDSIEGTTATSEQLLQFVGTLPGLTTVGGWFVAILFGGPLGLFGYPIGVAGGNMMLPPDPNLLGGLIVAAIGGVLTWGGVKSGGWRPFL